MANDLVTITDGKARIELHAGQKEAWLSDSRFVFVIAGTQSGKTSFGPWWLWREIKRCGPGDYLAVTATYDLFKLKMLPELKRVFTEYLGGWDYRAGDRVLMNDAGDTRIILRSANAPEGLEAATAKAAWMDECGQDQFRLESWEAIQRRLSLHQGRGLGTTTPYNLGWLKSEIYDKWRNGDPDLHVIRFASTMNPNFSMAEYERAKRNLPLWKFMMFYRGEFTRPAGMIYSDFNDKINTVDPFAIPKEWPRYVGIDFGAVNTATVWLAEDTERACYYVYRDTLEGELTTKEHASRVLNHGKAERVLQYAGGARSEKQQRWDWRSAGVPIPEPRIHDVESGIDRVIALIKQGRLLVFRDCKGILDEIGTYSRELDERGQPTEKIKNKETFHRLDALRYIVQSVTDRAKALL
jgi:hypothetical protein